MIIGLAQSEVKAQVEKLWDYSAVFYPEGIINSDNLYLFDSDQIETVFCIGFQDIDIDAVKHTDL